MPSPPMMGATLGGPPNVRFCQPGHQGHGGIFPGPQYMHGPIFNNQYRMPNLPMPPMFRQRLPRFRPRYPKIAMYIL